MWMGACQRPLMDTQDLIVGASTISCHLLDLTNLCSKPTSWTKAFKTMVAPSSKSWKPMVIKPSCWSPLLSLSIILWKRDLKQLINVYQYSKLLKPNNLSLRKSNQFQSQFAVALPHQWLILPLTMVEEVVVVSDLLQLYRSLTEMLRTKQS